MSHAPFAIHKQFDKHAQNWHLFGSPLRPCAADMQLMQRGFNDWRTIYPAAPAGGPLKALLLGVTPEIATHEWGVPVDLTAVDISQAMINTVWPGETAMRHAHCADWMTMPVAQHDFDMLLADGVFTLLGYSAGYKKLAQIIQHCLKPDGLFMLRAFCRPATPKTLTDIFDDLWKRRIGSLHAFKWRLAMALQGDDIHLGVPVTKVWDAYHANVPDPQRLAQATGWPMDVLATMDAYRDSAAIYTFPSMDELITIITPHLSCTHHETASYELAECCPTLYFKPYST